MLRPRVIPCLLLQNQGLVKGIKFKDHRYVGDPINAVHIFNSKEVDEILFLDISATSQSRIPDPEMIQRIADQCLVPFAVGGGIRTLEDAALMIKSGAEKVCINTAAFQNPSLITQIANRFGVQSVVVSVDVKKSLFGKMDAYTHCGTQKASTHTVEEWMQIFEKAGAGEILLNLIDRDGTREGYDLSYVNKISASLNVPLIIAGGAGSTDHMKEAIANPKVSAVAAGSMFVFHGRKNAVLISYPDETQLQEIYACR